MTKKIVFNDGLFTTQSVKDVQGNLHQRINQRHEIRLLDGFMSKHPMRKR